MIKLGIVMDPIANINIKKDSSFAMLLEAQRRGYELHYMEMADLYLINGEARANFSKAFIGIDGWQPETGFTGRDMMRTDVVNAVLEKECEAIVLTDSSKFGAVHSYSIGPVERFNRVITDSKIRASDLMHLEHSKLTVHVVDI